MRLLMKKNINIPLKFNSASIAVMKMAAHDVPVFKEIHNKEYVFFGKHNEYPDYLISLYNRSAKHNAIINGKMEYITGKGLGDIGETIVNSENETFGEIIGRAILDELLFGGLFIEVLWERGGKNIAELRHIDFSNVRSNKEGTKFFYTEKWTKKTEEDTFYAVSDPQNNKDFKIYTPYDEANKSGAQLFFYKCYRPGLTIYPLPEYQGAVVHIDIDVQIPDYWNNAIHNGFSASHIINFYNGVPTVKEQEKLEEQIGAKLTGARSKKYILNFSDKKEQGSDVQKLEPEDLDKHLQILNNTIQQEIFSGHTITSPMLFGIKTEGQLGGRAELMEADEIFQNRYVFPKQQVFEKLFSILASAKGITKEKLKFEKFESLGFNFSENIIKEILPPAALADIISKRMGIDLTKYPAQQKDVSGDRLGKIPLALQQLGLAQERALNSGDKQLADAIRAKMEELLNQLGAQTFSAHHLK